MKTQLFIPKKIKVGYQERSDTYTKRLAYVVYYDNKGQLRKELSWNSWCNKTLGSDEFENVPTEGFVLNKGVGGARQSYGWNARNEYIRVYDPRNFEFEISVKNLLFILSETNSFKGKGLEGTFVYSWDGKDLVLIPTSCSDYKASTNYTTLQDGKVSAKTLIKGGVYQTRKQEQLIYLGRFPWFILDKPKLDPEVYDRNNRYYHSERYNIPNRVSKELPPKHIFQRVKDLPANYLGEIPTNYYLVDSMENIASCVSDQPVSNYAELMEALGNYKFASKPVSWRSVPMDDFEVKPIGSEHYRYYAINGSFFKKISDTEFMQYKLNQHNRYDYYQNKNTDKITFGMYQYQRYTIKDGIISSYHVPGYGHESKAFTEEEIRNFGFEKVLILHESGKETLLSNY